MSNGLMSVTARKKIPPAIVKWLKEQYDFSCCMCGLPVLHNLHIHHIDENHSNDDVLNLLPLCPNCHLVDQHNPTRKIDPGILRFFREHKDPAIVMSQFKPLYWRMGFFKDVRTAAENINGLTRETYKYPGDERELYDTYIRVLKQSDELVEFVKAMNMGQFYGRKIQDAIFEAVNSTVHKCGQIALNVGHTSTGNLFDVAASHLLGRAAAEEEIVKLIVQMLCYQDWLPYSRFPKQHRPVTPQ